MFNSIVVSFCLTCTFKVYISIIRYCFDRFGCNHALQDTWRVVTRVIFRKFDAWSQDFSKFWSWSQGFFEILTPDPKTFWNFDPWSQDCSKFWSLILCQCYDPWSHIPRYDLVLSLQVLVKIMLPFLHLLRSYNTPRYHMLQENGIKLNPPFEATE